jgi:plastocyanin
MRTRFILFLAPAVFAIVSCGGGGGSNSSPTTPTTPTVPTTPTTPATPQATDKVTVADNQFSPADIQVSPGTTVTWTWAANASDHNVSFSDGATSGNKSSGTYTRTFSSGGTFPYSCTLHPGMSGTVTVK